MLVHGILISLPGGWEEIMLCKQKNRQDLNFTCQGCREAGPDPPGLQGRLLVQILFQWEFGFPAEATQMVKKHGNGKGSWQSRDANTTDTA